MHVLIKVRSLHDEPIEGMVIIFDIANHRYKIITDGEGKATLTILGSSIVDIKVVDAYYQLKDKIVNPSALLSLSVQEKLLHAIIDFARLPYLPENVALPHNPITLQLLLKNPSKITLKGLKVEVSEEEVLLMRNIDSLNPNVSRIDTLVVPALKPGNYKLRVTIFYELEGTCIILAEKVIPIHVVELNFIISIPQVFYGNALAEFQVLADNRYPVPNFTILLQFKERIFKITTNEFGKACQEFPTGLFAEKVEVGVETTEGLWLYAESKVKGAWLWISVLASIPILPPIGLIGFYRSRRKEILEITAFQLTNAQALLPLSIGIGASLFLLFGLAFEQVILSLIPLVGGTISSISLRYRQKGKEMKEWEEGLKNLSVATVREFLSREEF
jgi:hypothetical protein